MEIQSPDTDGNWRRRSPGSPNRLIDDSVISFNEEPLSSSSSSSSYLFPVVLKSVKCFCFVQRLQRGGGVLPGSDLRKPQRGLDQPAAALPHQGAEDQRRKGRKPKHTLDLNKVRLLMIMLHLRDQQPHTKCKNNFKHFFIFYILSATTLIVL